MGSEMGESRREYSLEAVLSVRERCRDAPNGQKVKAAMEEALAELRVAQAQPPPPAPCIVQQPDARQRPGNPGLAPSGLGAGPGMARPGMGDWRGEPAGQSGARPGSGYGGGQAGHTYAPPASTAARPGSGYGGGQAGHTYAPPASTAARPGSGYGGGQAGAGSYGSRSHSAYGGGYPGDGTQRELPPGSRLGGWGKAQAPAAASPPVKPLERSSNAFVPKTLERRRLFGDDKLLTKAGKLLKEGRSILNKLTLTKFDKLSNDLSNLEITDGEELTGIVNIIFDKALEEGHFCKMYAQLCHVIHPRMPEFANPSGGAPMTFKRCLLIKCQEEFERADRFDEDAANKGEAAETAGNKRKVRARMLGNISFIAQLFAYGMLSENIMHDCMKRLLRDVKEEDTLECLIKLMEEIGKLLDKEETRHIMDYYFEVMKQTADEIEKKPTMLASGTRLAKLIVDTIDLRKNSWKPRREKEAPKTMLEIRMQAARDGLLD